MIATQAVSAQLGEVHVTLSLGVAVTDDSRSIDSQTLLGLADGCTPSPETRWPQPLETCLLVGTPEFHADCHPGHDTHDFAPWHFDEIRERMKRKLVNIRINQTDVWHV